MSRSKDIEKDRIIQDRIADALEAANALATAAAGYDVTYTFPAVDFGDGDDNIIQGPAGLRGTVKNVTLHTVTEQFTDTTTEARVDIGVAGDDEDAYAITADLGTLDTTESASPALTPGVTGTIPAGGSVGVHAIPSGGTPAGIATVAVTINWYV